MMKTNIDSPYTRLDPEKSALLVIDVQNDFTEPEGAHPLPGTDDVVAEVDRAIEIFRRAEKPVVHVVRIAEPDGSNVDFCRRAAAEKGRLKLAVRDTWGVQPVSSTLPQTFSDEKSRDELLDCTLLLNGGIQKIGPNEYLIFKPRFSAFARTGLQAFLDKLGVNSVVLVGFTFPNCVRATQLGAVDLDFRVGLIPEACTQTDSAGLDTMRTQGVQVMSMNELKQFMG